MSSQSPSHQLRIKTEHCLKIFPTIANKKRVMKETLTELSGLRLIGHLGGRVPQEPLVFVLSASKAFVVIPFSLEQLLVVKYAVEFTV